MRRFFLCFAAISAASCAQILDIQDWQAGATASGSGGGETTSAEATGTASSTGTGSTCAVDCLGAPCVNGVCEALVVSDDTALGNGQLALDETYVYWTKRGAIVRVPKVSSATTQIPQEIVPNVGAKFIALDAQRLYWSNFASLGVVASQNKGGGSPLTFSNNEQAPAGLTVVGNTLYWLRYGAAAGGLESAIVAGAPMPSEVTPTSQRPFRIAADPFGTYWTYQGDVDMKLSGGVEAWNNGNTSVAEGQDEPSGIAIDADHIYWMTRNGALQRSPRNGFHTETIVPPSHEISTGEVAVDDAYVYFTTTGVDTCPNPASCVCDGPCRGKILRIAKDGDAPEEFFAGDGSGIFGLAVDAQAVYWTSPTRLYRKAKD